MDKKTKLMAICAAGAAAILIGAGLARCAIAPSDPNPVVPVEEQSRQAEQAGESLAGYAGTTWESEDGTCTLTLSDSTIVESGEAGVQVMYYEVLSEEPDDDGLSAQTTREAERASHATRSRCRRATSSPRAPRPGSSSPPTRRSSTSSSMPKTPRSPPP